MEEHKVFSTKLIRQYTSSHNSIPPINRGKWSKYNPYVDEKENGRNTTTIESLDDVFEDEPKKESANINTSSSDGGTKMNDD